MITSNKVYYWVPRIICICAILFLSLFALDSFDSRLTFWHQVGGILIHMIPMLILTALLIFTWKRELTGGIIFTVTGICLVVFYAINGSRNGGIHFMRMLFWGIMLFSPFILAGILFIIHHFKKK